MNNSESENEILKAALPYIRKICCAKWCNIEPEDRVSEASLFFLCALRSLPLNTGYFLKDFEAALKPYMDDLNRKSNSRYYPGTCSLDKNIRDKNNQSSISPYTLIKGGGLDNTRLEVHSFLHSLPIQERCLIYDLMYSDLSRAEAAEKYGLSVTEMDEILLLFGKTFIDGKWKE